MNCKCSSLKSALFFVLLNASFLFAESIIIDHKCTKFDNIPIVWIEQALASLDIVYTHTSHGSQLTTGMTGLAIFKNDARLAFANGGNGKLDLHDSGCNPYGAADLGNPDRVQWEKATRAYLADNPKTNVVVWSWCGQVSWASKEDIDLYLDLMNGLENDFPSVKFVYMTGHVIEGARDNNFERNEQIRTYCRENNKTLYDFADIECYDPDGNYFGDKWCTDACDYDANGDGNPYNDGANWAIEWQNSHTEGVDWYNCSSAHSQPLNANQKACAAWWLWARLAGWDGLPVNTGITNGQNGDAANFSRLSIFPNPFNATTTVRYHLNKSRHVNIAVYNVRGEKAANLVNEMRSAGEHSLVYNAYDLASGIYYAEIRTNRSSSFFKFAIIK